MGPSKVGILCVYYVPEDCEWIFHLQLKQIFKHSQIYNYKVFAAIVKCGKGIKRALETSDNIIVCRIDTDFDDPSVQHGMCLNQLFVEAVKDNCDFIITLDVDSFPINDEWISIFYRYASKSGGICAVHRRENGDVNLPHPCATGVTEEYFRSHRVEFYPSKEDLEGEEFKEFLRNVRQRIDTGIGLAYQLWLNNMDWAEVVRTNTVNLHFLMAGIYGDCVFHIGATSRDPLFYKEISENTLVRCTRRLSRLPFIWRVRNLFVITPVKRWYIMRNRRIMDSVKRGLTSDPAKFISSLQSPI